MVSICLTCGSEGYPEWLVFCSKCQVYALHRYCLDGPVIFFDDVTWFCEDCEPEKPPARESSTPLLCRTSHDRKLEKDAIPAYLKFKNHLKRVKKNFRKRQKIIKKHKELKDSFGCLHQPKVTLSNCSDSTSHTDQNDFKILRDNNHKEHKFMKKHKETFDISGYVSIGQESSTDFHTSNCDWLCKSSEPCEQTQCSDKGQRNIMKNHKEQKEFMKKHKEQKKFMKQRKEQKEHKDQKKFTMKHKGTADISGYGGIMQESSPDCHTTNHNQIPCSEACNRTKCGDNLEDTANSNKLPHSSRMKRYCLHGPVLFFDDVTWFCEDCEPEKPPALESSTSLPCRTNHNWKLERDAIPAHFNFNQVVINHPKRYCERFSRRDLCPALYIDLAYLKNSLGLDLYPYLGHYEKWLKIDTPFSPNMVRIFYNNLDSDSARDGNGNIITYSLVSTIRGQRIHLSAELINSFLGTHDYDTELKDLECHEIHELLKPEEPFKGLDFNPSSMPNLQRVIHYIYSRGMVNKSKNFTHLAQGDYPLLASIMAKEKRNVGQLIFNEIWKFYTSTSKRVTMPYPHLISKILQLHNVWYILKDDKPVKPQKFSEIHLHRMKIEIPVLRQGPSQSQRKKEPSGPSRGQDEAQSSASQQPSSAPSFLLASFQTFLQVEFQKLSAELQDQMARTIQEFQTLLHTNIQTYLTRVPTGANDYCTKLEQRLQALEQSVLSRFTALEERHLTSLLASSSIVPILPPAIFSLPCQGLPPL